MAYETALFGERDIGVLTRPDYRPRPEFRRLERIIVLFGGVALGAAGGLGAAIALGRPDIPVLIVSGGVMLTLALYLCSQTLRESFVRDAYGCAAATVAHAGALLAWPLTGLFAPTSALVFWMAPIIAISGLLLFASCWEGPPRAVYRLGLQGIVVMAMAFYQGSLLIMAG